MSSRDVIARDRALSATLRSFRSRSLQLAQRARWTGATHSYSIPSPVAITQDTSHGGPPTWTTVISLDLDGGNWMVVGFGIVDSGVGTLANFINGMRVAGSTETTERTFFNDDSVLQAHAPLSLTTAGQATLEFYSQSDFGGPPTTNDVLQATLIAYPV